MHSKADELIDEFSISTPSAKTEVRYLSGGNLQKVVLARELSAEPKVIIAEHPTRGLDIGAMEFVYKSLLLQKKEERLYSFWPENFTKSSDFLTEWR
jgi:simple sugar transport system ATP-binding protein